MPGAITKELKDVRSVTAEADLSSSRYLCVKKGTADDGVVLAGDGEEGWGIIQEDIANGSTGPMVEFGHAKAKAGGAFSPNDPLASDANGKLVSAANGEYVMARAVQAASADGDVVGVFVVASPYKRQA